MSSSTAATGKVSAKEIEDPTASGFVTADDMWFLLTGNATDGFTMSNSDGAAMVITSTNNGLKIESGASGTSLLFHTEDGLGTIVCGNDNSSTLRYVGLYNAQDWRCYTTVNNNIKGSTNYRWYHFGGE